MHEAQMPRIIKPIALEPLSPKNDVVASRNEYMHEFQTNPLNTLMSSTQRVQNLIRQKIEKRHREAIQDSFQLQSQVSETRTQNLKKKISAEFTQGNIAPSQKSQRTDCGQMSRKSGLIPVGHIQDDLQLSHQSRFLLMQSSGNLRNGNEMNTSITLSRLMLEDSLNVHILPDKKISLHAEADQIDSIPLSQVKSTLNSRPKSRRLKSKQVKEDLKQLDFATTALSPIQMKQSSSTASLDNQLRESSEELKSSNQQVTSDNKMRRFEDKFPTPSQIQRINSQKSLQTSGNRNQDQFFMPLSQSSRPSKLIFTSGSASSLLPSQRSSGMICSQVSQESPVCQRLIQDGLFKPLESQTQLFFSAKSEMQVHVEDQHNDSQLSFQNEDSKSDSYIEAPFERSKQDIQKSAIIQPNDIRPTMLTLAQENQTHIDNQVQDESQNTINPSSQQESQKTASGQAQNEYILEGIQSQQREISQSGVSPYLTNQRASNSNNGEHSSSSINDSAAPCSGAIQSRAVRQQIETRLNQREVQQNYDQMDIETYCRAPDNSLLKTTPDLISQLKSVNSSLIETSHQQEDEINQFAMIDYQTLNRIKQQNDMITTKLEVCNKIFELLLNEIKNELFPKRQIDIADLRPAESLVQNIQLPDSETIKQIVIDEKKLVRRQLKTSEKLQQSKPQSTKGRSSKTLPVVKFNKNGKPFAVNFMQARIDLNFFKDLKANNYRFTDSFDKFMIKYLQSSGSSEQADENTLVKSFQFNRIEGNKHDMQDHFNNLLAQNEKKQKSKLARKKLGANSLKEKTQGSQDLVNNLRGIKTSTDVAEQYMDNLFEALLQNEQDFLDSLATPFLQNPLIELLNIRKKNYQAQQITQSLKQTKSEIVHIADKKEDSSQSDDEVVQQQPVLSVEIYLDIERRKEYVLLADSVSDIDQSHASAKPELVEQQSMLAEWENIHNKLIFDAVNDALDEFRPYGLRGPPAPWSGQTRALTYRFSQNAREVLTQVREKVLGLSKTFGGALANSELLKEYHIKGPLESDKLSLLREERLAIMMIQDCEDSQRIWDDNEAAKTGIKFDIADLIIEQLVLETIAILQGQAQ